MSQSCLCHSQWRTEANSALTSRKEVAWQRAKFNVTWARAPGSPDVPAGPAVLVRGGRYELLLAPMHVNELGAGARGDRKSFIAG